jgi:zinc protease
MLQASFGHHPYGHPPEGRVRELRSARRGDVAAFHRGHYGPSAATLVVVGTAPAGEVLALARKRFGRWHAENGVAAPVQPPALPRTTVVVVDKPDVTQSQVRIASGGFARRSPDYHAGVVASALLGGGFTSRLMEAIRVNRGLSYGVRSRFATSAAGGLFFISTFTEVETTAEIIDVALEETARFCDGGPTAEELERMQAYLCGLFPLSLETHEQLAEKLADLALYDLPDEEVSAFRERVRAVGPEQAREVARRYFPVGDRLVVAVGPAKAIARSLERWGPVTVLPARKLA